MLCIVLIAAACGGSSDDEPKDDGSGTTSTTEEATTTSSKPAKKTTTTASTTEPVTTDTGPTSTSAPSSASSTTGTSVAPGSTSAPATTRPFEAITSDQWVLQNLGTSADAAGKWAGTAAIRNDNPDPRDGDFVLTLKRGSATVATLTGSATGVPGGAIAEVSLTSTDGYTPGEYSIDFKATFGF